MSLLQVEVVLNKKNDFSGAGQLLNKEINEN